MSEATDPIKKACDGYTTTNSNDGKLYISIEDTRNLKVATEKTLMDAIPETVLKYERQMRKVAAAKRAESDVTKEEHLKIVYKDEHLVVTNKPSGILCVPGINRRSSLSTLVHKEYAQEIQPMDRIVVHRLDMDTSGLVVFGRSLHAVSELHKIFRDRLVDKCYEALVCGHVVASGGVIDLPLQRDHERPPFMRVATSQSEHAAAQVVQDLQHHGWKKIMRRKPKPSKTEFTVLAYETLTMKKKNDNNTQDNDDDDNSDNTTIELPVTRLQLKPITGRTHQLRVHCAAFGHPIVGDPAYGIFGEASANGGFSECIMDTLAPGRASLQLQKQINNFSSDVGGVMCLHAKKLSLKHPITGIRMDWEAKALF